MTKKQLMEKYGIKSVGGGTYGEGFFDCLKGIEEKAINIFKHDHVIKRINFAKEKELPYDWLINQLNNDYKRNVGVNYSAFGSPSENIIANCDIKRNLVNIK